MQLPQLTLDQIHQRCTEQSYTRGLNYFHAGAIGNPVLHGYTLSATCDGSDIDPYRVTVELTSTEIASTYCSCPYDWAGDCKHIVALLLTYLHEPDTLLSLEPLFATLEAKPKSNLIQIISELLKRAPELLPIAQVYSDIPVIPPDSGPLPLVTAYREQIDSIFEDSFPEQHHLHQVLAQLESLRQQAASLAQLGEMDRALSILHALIHECTVHYSDMNQTGELPWFVDKCTHTFTEIVVNAQEPVEILEHCRMLLRLSFDAAEVFTPLLTYFLEQLCLTEDLGDLETEMKQNLDESPDQQAHVRLLLALDSQSDRTEDDLRLARFEGEG